MKQCPFGIECEKCRFFKSVILTNDRGEQKAEDRCTFEVLFDVIPRIIGSIDGCQRSANETRNSVIKYAEASTNAIQAIPQFVEALAVRTIKHADGHTE